MYEAKTFDIPELDGLSSKAVEVHLGLYNGYVKHVNHIQEELKNVMDDYAKTEMQRRLGFEFNGMRMHEYYFSQLERGSSEFDTNSKLNTALIEKYDSFDGFVGYFSKVAMSRGIGWTILYADPKAHTLHTAWVSDHELGQLGGLPIILALDMWEHAFMVDYMPADKGQYVDAFLKNLNWTVVTDRFQKVIDSI